MSKLDNLKSKRSRLLASATEFLTVRGIATPALKVEYDAKVKEIDTITEDIDALSYLEAELGTRAAHTPAPVVAAPAIITRTSAQERKDLNSSYRHYAKNGHLPGHPEQRDLTVDSTGVALVPQQFDEVFALAQRWVSPIGSLVKKSVGQPSGAGKKVVVSSDIEATMTFLTNGSQAVSGIESDPVLVSKIPSTDSLVTNVSFSIELLEDAYFLEKFVRELAAVRVARSVGFCLLTGTDNGSNTQLTNSPTGGFLGSLGSPAVTTTALASGLNYQNMVALKGSVNAAYSNAPGAGFLVNQTTHTYLTSQVDGEGRPFYKFNDDGTLIVAGRPVYIADDSEMPGGYSTANSIAAVYGDFSRAYEWLDGGGMRFQVLKERFADQFLASAVIYHRLGAAALVSGAVSSLKMAAS